VVPNQRREQHKTENQYAWAAIVGIKKVRDSKHQSND
jgi:hypothetical protein